ncbi:MAG: flagellar basal body P-ring formation protein FlgA [Lentisphaeraceae bacterium]|nr:flagellar basal body P-ring formation protein FlgA [Lentisphaeraceae bacterium]
MKKATLISLIFFFTLSLFGGQRVRLRSQVQVSGRFVQLKELVIDDSPLTEEQKNIIITEAPLRGNKTYKRLKLLRLMANNKELLSLDVTSPPTIQIFRIANTGFIEDTKEKLILELKKVAPWKDSKIDLEFSPGDLSKLSNMSGADQIELLSQSPSTAISTHKLRVKFTSKKQNLGTISLTPFIRQQIELVILKNSCPKGHILKRSDLQISKTWSDGYEDKFASSLQECLGYEIKKNTPEGSRIKRNLLAPPVYAQRHQILLATLDIGGMSIGITLKALEQGRRGEIIRAKNTKSGKLLDVTLTGPGRAIIN